MGLLRVSQAIAISFLGLVGRSSGRILPLSMRMPSRPAGNASCPCADTSLCRTPTVHHEREVFGFGGDGWENFDWTQVTTVAWANDPMIICQAHKTGARIIAAADHVVFSSNITERHEWISNLIATLKSHFFDGVTFDYESPLDKTPGSATFLQHQNYLALVRETTTAVHEAILGSQVSVCVAWSPDNIDGRNYDYEALAQASDLLYMMVYDTRSQIYGRCTASANSPLSLAQRGAMRYMQLGIPAQKLVLGTPWYGYRYPCLNDGPHDDDVCQIKLVPFRGVNCSDAAGSEVAFYHIMNLLDRNVCIPNDGKVCNVTSGLMWDDSTQSPYFNYRVDSKPHQMWFDNAKSSSLKYATALQMGLRGVGPYEWSDLDSNGSITKNPLAPTESKAMWDALKVFSQAESHNRGIIV